MQYFQETVQSYEEYANAMTTKLFLLIVLKNFIDNICIYIQIFVLYFLYSNVRCPLAWSLKFIKQQFANPNICIAQLDLPGMMQWCGFRVLSNEAFEFFSFLIPLY